jgi:CutA1 divalent ion tolerance protein
VHELAEGRVSLHTSQNRIADIVALAQREHPYEVPSVSAWPIIDGNPDYLAWRAEETDPTGGRRQRAGPGRTGPASRPSPTRLKNEAAMQQAVGELTRLIKPSGD